MRTCTTCHVEKPLTEFWKDRSKKHGYTAKCKPCKTVNFNAYRKAHGYDHRRYWKNPAGERERHLKRKYGVTLVEYARMLTAQGDACAICCRRQERAFDVDHDHLTQAVRGLLCTNCNRMIGHSADSPERLEAAAEYLRASSRKSRLSS